MAAQGIDHGDSQALGRLMGVGGEKAGSWEPDELAGILRHQLATPLKLDLGPAGPAMGAGAMETFGDLLRRPDPPLDLLKRTKDFAKAHRDDPNSSLPDEIATVVYFAGIGAALARHGARISELDDGRLRRGLQWAIDQPWVDEQTRSLLREALGHLAPHPGKGP